ncbi:MAG: hypothetical protein J0H08_10685 [Rhizobiales bacterium]|mgnify:CR=1 FL=1|nr:hypothetical protein [Hyphomicrobiales bacterium]MCB1502840.1 hypothetical protein [Bauldia sp.]
MTERVNVTDALGPIRIQVSASERVTLRIVSAPVSVRVVGTPGPDGRLGPIGPQGPVGPVGNLDAGIIVDGGNF